MLIVSGTILNIPRSSMIQRSLHSTTVIEAGSWFNRSIQEWAVFTQKEKKQNSSSVYAVLSGMVELIEWRLAWLMHLKWQLHIMMACLVDWICSVVGEDRSKLEQLIHCICRRWIRIHACRLEGWSWLECWYRLEGWVLAWAPARSSTHSRTANYILRDGMLLMLQGMKMRHPKFVKTGFSSPASDIDRSAERHYADRAGCWANGQALPTTPAVPPSGIYKIQWNAWIDHISEAHFAWWWIQTAWFRASSRPRMWPGFVLPESETRTCEYCCWPRLYIYQKTLYSFSALYHAGMNVSDSCKLWAWR